MIGIIAGFIPMHDRRLGDEAKFGIGEDMASLFASGALDYWVILYGSGQHEYCDAVGVIKVTLNIAELTRLNSCWNRV